MKNTKKRQKLNRSSLSVIFNEIFKLSQEHIHIDISIYTGLTEPLRFKKIN